MQASANLPFSTGDTIDTPHARAYADTLDAQNVPVSSGVVTIHIGNTPLIRGMRVIPLLMASVLGVLMLSGIVMLRSESAADRERVFAGMARESAHQLGTPLSSLKGWIELLRERDDPMIAQALPHMEGDVERLERVAHRFERIGRPPGATRWTSWTSPGRWSRTSPRAYRRSRTRSRSGSMRRTERPRWPATASCSSGRSSRS